MSIACSMFGYMWWRLFYPTICLYLTVTLRSIFSACRRGLLSNFTSSYCLSWLGLESLSLYCCGCLFTVKLFTHINPTHGSVYCCFAYIYSLISLLQLVRTISSPSSESSHMFPAMHWLLHHKCFSRLNDHSKLISHRTSLIQDHRAILHFSVLLKDTSAYARLIKLPSN